MTQLGHPDPRVVRLAEQLEERWAGARAADGATHSASAEPQQQWRGGAGADAAPGDDHNYSGGRRGGFSAALVLNKVAIFPVSFSFPCSLAFR